MKNKVSEDIVVKWLKAWSLSRDLPLPIHYKSGFKVKVNDEKQKERYVFIKPDQDFFELAEMISEAWIYLKVCTSPDHFMKAGPKEMETSATRIYDVLFSSYEYC